jgi:YD repeat-containing protein
VLTRTDPRGYTTGYGYGGLDRLERETFAESGVLILPVPSPRTRTIGYLHDANGKPRGRRWWW